MDVNSLFDEQKTTYSIKDEHGEKSTITLDKWAADILQNLTPDVHAWIQEKYELVCLKRSHLSRREKGNIVRALARREAEKSPSYKSILDAL